jgi:hypothetical protein
MAPSPPSDHLRSLHRLTIPRTPLVGRDAEIAAVCALLQRRPPARHPDRTGWRG